MATSLSLSSRILITLIRIYQCLISPLFRPSCRFIPTCSNYGIKAFYNFGAIRGSWLIIKRILKCHPLHIGGHDPLPPRTFDTREQ